MKVELPVKVELSEATRRNSTRRPTHHLCDRVKKFPCYPSCLFLAKRKSFEDHNSSVPEAFLSKEVSCRCLLGVRISTVRSVAPLRSHHHGVLAMWSFQRVKQRFQLHLAKGTPLLQLNLEMFSLLVGVGRDNWDLELRKRISPPQPSSKSSNTKV